MATAQIVSATTALHDEKIDEQFIKNIDDPQETTVTAPQPSEDQLLKEHAADNTVAPEPEPELAAPETEPQAEAESEALAAEVETKVVLKEEKEEEGKVNPVDQTAKVAPEPCVEEEAKTETETKPTEVAKVEPEPEAEPEEKVVEKEGGAAEE